jgi:tetraacyldisaccharide 4'-kinase
MNTLPVTLPLSWLYGAGVAIRNRRYDRDPDAAGRLDAPVVSVGNLTVGGSGKTPLVAAVARELLGRGLRVAVLSRGYRRRSQSPFILVSGGEKIHASWRESGDEPLELAQSLPGLAVGVGPDRLSCGRELLQRLGPHVLVLDDGFQHRKLHRDLDIVCFDAGEPESSLRLLPAGRLREPLSSLRRAGALVWTRWSPERPSGRLREIVSRAAPELPQIRARNRLVKLARVGGGEDLAPDALLGEPVGVLLGIARPERVLESLPARVVFHAARADHHEWTNEEVQALALEAKSKGAKALLTTGKDAVKMTSAQLALPLYALRVETEILDAGQIGALLACVMSS